MRVLLLFSSYLTFISAQGGDGQSALVLKAIQQSRQRQSSRVASSNSPKKIVVQQPRPIAQQKAIDVEGLNNLIKSFDKTWVMPKLGAKEPTGSNFQYKKTCASIYKARPGACSQLGFGSMCFNYCYEKGEKVQYTCMDASDAAYCKSSSNFDAFLNKYKKDAYKAKAYVHQMISRCFATSLCNGQTILEASAGEMTTPKSRGELGHLKLTRPPNGNVTKRVRTTTTTTTTTEEPELPKATTRRKVPEWQKLMSRSSSTTEATIVTTPEEEDEDTIETTTVDVDEEEETTTTTTKPVRGAPPVKRTTSTLAPLTFPTFPTIASTLPTLIPSTTTVSRATWKPLRLSTPPPPSPDLSLTSERTPKEDVFWNRFQPNTWYQSIHYFTNTGRR